MNDAAIYSYPGLTLQYSNVEAHLSNYLAMKLFRHQIIRLQFGISLHSYALPQSDDIISCRKLVLCVQRPQTLEEGTKEIGSSQ